MSEWVSVLIVFWVLWALDGGRIGPRRVFTFVSGQRRRAGYVYSRLSRPGFWPGCWRMTVADVPLAISPLGICNRLVGAAGRPAEQAPPVQAWRWEEVRKVGVAGGWIFVNDGRFCPDAGHLPAPLLLALAGSAPHLRAARIDRLMRSWLRPEHLRRRARIFAARTAGVARLNIVSWFGLGALSLYLAGDLAGRVPSDVSERFALALPWVAAGLLGLHVTAVVLAWKALGRLPSMMAEKRRANLLGALLLPPQALRLRSSLAEGFFPAQHPLAPALAFGGSKARSEIAFNVMADLRWPVGEADMPPLAREITEGFRAAFEAKVTEALAAADFRWTALLDSPAPDAPASCSYCPRCRAQFLAGPDVCPNGVVLRSLKGPGSSR